MIPRISMTVIVVVLIGYFIGARWPMLAQRVGVA